MKANREPPGLDLMAFLGVGLALIIVSSPPNIFSLPLVRLLD